MTGSLVDDAAWAPLDLAVARDALGLGSRAALPAAAAEAIALGAQGDALSRLAAADARNEQEIASALAAIYRDERGAKRPKGRKAAELVGADVLRGAIAGDLDAGDAIAAIVRLWELSGFSEGDLSDLGIYEEHLELARAGELRSTPERVIDEFLAEARRIVAAGGPSIPGWHPSAR
jgi:hypothetical protein